MGLWASFLQATHWQAIWISGMRLPDIGRAPSEQAIGSHILRPHSSVAGRDDVSCAPWEWIGWTGQHGGQRENFPKTGQIWSASSEANGKTTAELSLGGETQTHNTRTLAAGPTSEKVQSVTELPWGLGTG